MATETSSRNLEFAAYGYGAAALLALLCIAIAASFAIFPGRANAVVVLAVIGAASAAPAAWRLWNDDAGYAVGALAYVSIFALGLAAVIALVSPAALGLAFNQLCGGDTACRTQLALKAQQQSGYVFSGIAAVLGLGGTLFGVSFLTVERHRRRQL